MRWDLLNWLANVLNYAIFAFISINLVGSRCFNTKQMIITSFGLFVSLMIQLLTIIIKKYK